MAITPKLMRINEVAAYLSISEQTFRRWIRQKRFTLKPSKRGGGQGNPYLYSLRDVMALRQLIIKQSAAPKSTRKQTNSNTKSKAKKTAPKQQRRTANGTKTR